MNWKTSIRVLFIGGILVLWGQIASAQTTKWAQEFYNEVPTIKIRSPEGVEVGSLSEGKDILTIGITDVGLYTGHVCICISSGYRITQLALKALYENEVPVRGDIQVVCGKYGEPAEGICYITGARLHPEEDGARLLVDENLIKEKGAPKFVFTRLSTGKTVMVTFFKKRVISEKTWLKIRAIKQKIKANKATDNEKYEMKTLMQNRVKKILLCDPAELFEIKELDNYQPPQSGIQE